jgi:carbamoyl-phosphate synthase large subunit
MVYSKFRRHLSDRGTRVLVSAPNVIVVARDKGKTAEFLIKHGIPVPVTWQISEALKLYEDISFPLLLKPKDGSCSKGIFTVGSIDALRVANVDAAQYVAQELCQGQEYTINAYYTPDGRCVSCVPHLRVLVRAGEVCFAETVRISAFTEIAHQFSKIFKGIRGNICFQGFKEPDDNVRIFEINARFGGGYPICNRAGGTFARWILQELMGQEPDYNDNWNEGLRMMRYDAAVFSQLE